MISIWQWAINPQAQLIFDCVREGKESSLSDQESLFSCCKKRNRQKSEVYVSEGVKTEITPGQTTKLVCLGWLNKQLKEIRIHLESDKLPWGV